jgi:hypothetical protein
MILVMDGRDWLRKVGTSEELGHAILPLEADAL